MTLDCEALVYVLLGQRRLPWPSCGAKMAGFARSESKEDWLDLVLKEKQLELRLLD